MSSRRVVVRSGQRAQFRVGGHGNPTVGFLMDEVIGFALAFLLHCWRMAHKVDSRQVIYFGRQMGLNIKNQETCELAGEFARLTGETKTGAITVALRERLDRERRVRNAARRLRAMQAIADRCARLLGPGPSAIDHGDVLYDDRGLPA